MDLRDLIRGAGAVRPQPRGDEAVIRRLPHSHEYLGFSHERASRRELALVQASARAGFVGHLPAHLNALRRQQRAG